MNTTIYLTAAQVRRRYGGVNRSTLFRWMKCPAVAFPKPEPIRSRNYWRIDQLDAWDESRRPIKAEA